MKKGLIYIIGLLFLVSCNNQDEVGIKYELTAEVDASGLVSKMINPYDNVDFFPDGKVKTGFSVRTKYLIYDENEKLIEEDSAFNSSFNVKTSFAKLLTPGLYTIVSIVNVVSDEGTFWGFSDLKDLNSAKVVLGDYIPLSHGIIGIHKETVDIKEKKSISFEPKNIGALYVVNFSNVDISKIRYIDFGYDINPDVFKINTKEYKYSAPFYSVNKSWDNKGYYNDYYYYMYLLQSDELDFKFTLYDVNKNDISGTYSIPIKVVAGEHLLLGLDLEALKYDFYDLSSAPKRKIGAIRNSQKNFLMLKDLGNTQLN